MTKQHKDTIIAHLEINLMSEKEKVKEMIEILKYIYEKKLVIRHGSAGILHQKIGKIIETTVKY